MKKQLDKLAFFTGLILGIALILFVQWAVRFYKSGVDEEVVEDPEYNFNMILTLLNDNCVWDYDVDELYKGAYVGMVEAIGDKYTRVIPYTGKENVVYEDVEYIYIGAEIRYTTNMEYPTIESLQEGGNAERAGIRVGDEIITVNGASTEGLNIEEVIAMFKGNVGQEVVLVVKRGEETIEVKTELQKKVTITIAGQKLDNNIGYIKIDKFRGNTAEQFEEAYKELSSHNIEKLIIDLRGNLGGDVQEALKICDMFLDNGELMLSQKNKRGEITEYRAEREKMINEAVVILQDNNSASSSEILTMCLKDNGIATVVGEKSFGKGIAQTTFLATEAFAMNITTHYNFSPNGTCIHDIGIMPDIEVKDNPETEEDEAIETAVGQMKN